MNKNLRWKVITTFAVLALAVFFFYPPQQKVKLGLDLKGGVHLVLKVQTDDAVKLETEVTAERLRETHARRAALRRHRHRRAADPLPRRRRAAGQGRRVPPPGRRVATTMFNRTSAGLAAYTFELKPNQVERAA